MITTIRSFVQLALLAVLATQSGLAQQTNSETATPEVHTVDMRKALTEQVLNESAGCQQVRKTGTFVLDERKVDPATLAPDLTTLMEKSDEVVLVAIPFAHSGFLSLGGRDIVTYADAKVLRTWKGSHKVGETITYALPEGHTECHGPEIKRPGIFETHTGSADWLGSGWGPYVLFLRRSQGQEAEFMPGLRLTGGSGLQGMFLIPYDLHDSSCNGLFGNNGEKCRAFLESSAIPISVRYLRDPLFKTYDRMPAWAFFNEMDLVAYTLGYARQVDVGK